MVVGVVLFLGVLLATGTVAAQVKIPPVLDNVIGKLVETSKELKLERQLPAYGERADLLAFSYETALRKRSNVQFGDWNEGVKNETVLVIYLNCPIIEYPNLPMNRQGYREKVVEIRKYLFSGAFDRMISRLALRPRWLALTYDDFVKAKPQRLSDLVGRPEDLMDIELLNETERMRQRFQ